MRMGVCDRLLANHPRGTCPRALRSSTQGLQAGLLSWHVGMSETPGSSRAALSADEQQSPATASHLQGKDTNDGPRRPRSHAAPKDRDRLAFEEHDQRLSLLPPAADPSPIAD